ncbi:DUF2797 domain-containing protein [Actinomycetaceae bacterium TAE3-ERU4]|nr:DUF2797 domain-containing protein [Actinomycetaceae bacterium TAE3-ERU4]
MLGYITKFSAQETSTVANLRLLSAEGEPLANELASNEKNTLQAGEEIRFHLTGKRRCIGSSRFAPEGGFMVVPCRTARQIEKGTQCYPCARADQSRLIHNTPREKASELLYNYLNVPHFLYLAIFADGTMKVGTSRSSRIVSRWVEQGAVMTLRVADYADGWQVREAERAVSKIGGISQAVRADRKAKSFLKPLSVNDMSDSLITAAAEVMEILTQEGLRGSEPNPQAFAGIVGTEVAPKVLTQIPGTLAWINTVTSDYLALGKTPVNGGMLKLTSGEHQLKIVSLAGTTAFVRKLEESENTACDLLTPEGKQSPLYTVNLGALKAHEIDIQL